MQNIVNSMKEELDAMTSGHFVPYYKAAIVVAAIVSLIFSLLFTHGTVFEGKIAVIDLDNSPYSTELISKVNTSPYIEINDVFRNPIDPVALVAHDRNLGVLYLPKGLEESLKRGNKSVRLGYFADQSNESQNAKVLQSLQEYIPELGAEISVSRVSALGLGEEATKAALSPMQLKSRSMFNPTGASTISTTIYFVYFFSSLTYGLTMLMIIGRLKATGMWQSVLERGPLALMSRIVPYAFFYTTAITIMSALFVCFGQLRFDGNYFTYLPSIFMTGLAFGWLAFILSWTTKTPGEGAGRMTFLVPPGFILGGSTMAVGFLPVWAYYASYAFPLVWQYRFYRDFAMRGRGLLDMLPTYGAYIIFLTVVAAVITLLYYQAKNKMVQIEGNNHYNRNHLKPL